MARGAGRGDCSREAIILSVSVKGRTIIRGRRLIEGPLLFEEIPYTVDCLETLEDVSTDDFEEGSGDEDSIWCERQKKEIVMIFVRATAVAYFHNGHSFWPKISW